jgi:hypothetical protein
MLSSRILPFVLFVVLAGLLGTGCAKKTISQKGDKAIFKDDLSEFRPTYKTENNKSDGKTGSIAVGSQSNVKPMHDITARLDTSLNAIAQQNKSIRYAQGYRIQIYSGNNSDEAKKARDRSYALFPDTTPHLIYNQPTFRVKVGDFIDRLEAQRVYAGLISEFPNAMVIQDRIEIK